MHPTFYKSAETADLDQPRLHAPGAAPPGGIPVHGGCGPVKQEGGVYRIRGQVGTNGFT